MSVERYEVAKAGGWSLATAERARSVMAYLQSNPDIHYFVPSAPGAINDRDTKVTDRLINCYKHREAGESFEEDFTPVYNQFITTAENLGYPGIEKLLDPIEQGLRRGENYHWVVSRGETINGRMLADILGWRFIDPTELIRFRKDDRFDERSYQTIRSRLRGQDRFVIPGFYGLGADGQVKTFPRDGSDISGAIIAYGVNAPVYRNLTRTNGVYSADPEIVSSVRSIPVMTFKEARELGNGGLKVLHRDAIIPCMRAGTEINVRCSEEPDSLGTMIVARRNSVAGEGAIGIAGKDEFASLYIYKMGLDEEVGTAEKILRAFRRSKIPISHMPTNIDDISVVFTQQQLTGTRENQIMEAIERLGPSEMTLIRDKGILSIVGQELRETGSKIVARLEEVLDGIAIKHGIAYNYPSIVVRAFLADDKRLKEAIIEAHKELIEEK